MWNLIVFDYNLYKISNQIRLHYQDKHKNHQGKWFESGYSRQVDKLHHWHYHSFLKHQLLRLNLHFQDLLRETL